MQISRLMLHTKDVAEIGKFYGKLGFRILMAKNDEVRIQIGATELSFRQGGAEAFYHFAFNIPENQVTDSISWLKLLGIQVLTYEGHEIVEFGPPFAADACYFHDPAGNIVELIARHRLQNANLGDFSSDKIECVSEIGLPTQNVRDLSQTLRSVLDENVFAGENSDSFTAIGDDEGLFIVVKEGWAWLPTGREAKVFPLKVVLSNHRTVSISGPENKYVTD